MDKSDISKIAMAVRRDAEQRKNDAGYGGEWGDRGASGLTDKLSFWMAGLECRIPSEFQVYLDKANREADSEFAEFQRLKAKFGDGA